MRNNIVSFVLPLGMFPIRGFVSIFILFDILYKQVNFALNYMFVKLNTVLAQFHILIFCFGKRPLLKSHCFTSMRTPLALLYKRIPRLDCSQTWISDRRRKMWQKIIICLGLFCTFAFSEKAVGSKDIGKDSTRQKKRNFIF